MIRTLTLTIAERLEFYHQDHLLRGWESLSNQQQFAFARELEQVDFDHLIELFEEQRSGKASHQETPQQKASRARPPAALVRQPRTDADQARWRAAEARGEQLLTEGRVGAILVAGGQGTRLGFDHPKGMFPIGPVSNATLFQLFCEQILARSRRAGKPIPYYIMTSDATHAETVAFFKEHRNFGLPDSDVRFFRQGTMPAIDAKTGKLLMAAPGQLAMSPDGHGGLLQALQKSALLDDMNERGIDFLYYHQVDNPLAIVVDPAYLGWHASEGADVSTKVVAKSGPEEKMGVAVDVDGLTQIIEYSDLPKEAAHRLNADGELELWAGSTAIHIFSREFLNRLTAAQWNLPFHVAHKAVPHLAPETGDVFSPKEPNAYKFERFIFDVLPEARKALVVEADRKREFAPLKNASGVHSADDVKCSLIAVFRDWLTTAGVKIPADTPVEISPLVAIDASEFAAKVQSGLQAVKSDAGPLWKP